MSDGDDGKREDNDETPFSILGLPKDASMLEVKARYKKLSDAYLKILEQSRNAPATTGNASVQSKPPQPNDNNTPQQRAQTGKNPNQQTSFQSQQETHTEPISKIKEKLASGKINESQFKKLALERYEHLKNKPFSDLSDSELEERLKGFEGLKIDPKYWKSKDKK